MNALSTAQSVVKESKETIHHHFLKTNKDECSSGPSMIFAPPLPGSALLPFQLEVALLVCTIPSIFPSRCTTHTTLSSQVQCILKQHPNVQYSVFAVRVCPAKLIISLNEACDTGKGANTVISLLHHFLANHALGETHLHLHADNCAGQNKNKHFFTVLCMARTIWPSPINYQFIHARWAQKNFT